MDPFSGDTRIILTVAAPVLGVVILLVGYLRDESIKWRRRPSADSIPAMLVAILAVIAIGVIFSYLR
jgi:hypothetical protein